MATEQNTDKNIDSERKEKLDMAESLYSQKKFEEAIATLVNYQDEDSSGSFANFIGNCYQQMGQLEEAIKSWLRAVRISPNCFNAFINIGNVYYSMKEYNKAISFWHIASTVKPEDLLINYNLAVTYNTIQDRFHSIYFYEKYLKYSITTTEEHFEEVDDCIKRLRRKAGEELKKATLAISQNNINLGMQCYLRSITNYPLQPKLLGSLAKAFYTDRNYEKAIYYYKMLLSLDESSKIPLMDIGNSYLALKNYPLAYCYFMRFLQNAMERDTEITELMTKVKAAIPQDYDVEIHLNEAQALENKSQFFEALIEYENYQILSTEENYFVNDSIDKLKLFLSPEKYITDKLMKKVKEMEESTDYMLIIALCNRIILLSDFESKNAFWASKRKQWARKKSWEG